MFLTNGAAKDVTSPIFRIKLATALREANEAAFRGPALRSLPNYDEDEVAVRANVFATLTATLPTITGMLAGLARAKTPPVYQCERKAICVVCLEKNGILPISQQRCILQAPQVQHQSDKLKNGMVRIEELLTHLRANRDCAAHQFYITVLENLFPHLKAYWRLAEDYLPDQCEGFFLP